jgi:glycine cleavage system transcriptional repressor
VPSRRSGAPVSCADAPLAGARRPLADGHTAHPGQLPPAIPVVGDNALVNDAPVNDALVNEIAVTVVGPDRPGIVAEVSGALADLGLNLTDSTMTLLRGHFAMMLVCTSEAGPTQVSAADVNAALAPLTDQGHLVAVARPLLDEPVDWPDESESIELPNTYTLVVHGADRLGIVAAMTAVLARAGGNITDLTTRLAGALYLLTAEVDLPPGTDDGALAADLQAEAERLGVVANLTAAEADML